MRKHTTIDLDMELVRAAGEALGTAKTTDTVHSALADVVARRRRESLYAIETDLDLTGLAEIRGHRFAETAGSYEKSED